MNIDMNATRLFTSQGANFPGDNFLFKIGEAGEGGVAEGTFDSSSILSWTPVSNILSTIIYHLNIIDTNDVVALQFNVTVPLDEDVGAKESTIFIVAYASEY